MDPGGWLEDGEISNMDAKKSGWLNEREQVSSAPAKLVVELVVERKFEGLA